MELPQGWALISEPGLAFLQSYMGLLWVQKCPLNRTGAAKEQETHRGKKGNEENEVLSNRRWWIIGTRGGERNSRMWPYYAAFFLRRDWQGDCVCGEPRKSEGGKYGRSLRKLHNMIKLDSPFEK